LAIGTVRLKTPSAGGWKAFVLQRASGNATDASSRIHDARQYARASGAEGADSLTDVRINVVKAALQVTPDQEKFWPSILSAGGVELIAS
jgi:hypothetical protein